MTNLTGKELKALTAGLDEVLFNEDASLNSQWQACLSSLKPHQKQLAKLLVIELAKSVYKAESWPLPEQRLWQLTAILPKILEQVEQEASTLPPQTKRPLKRITKLYVEARELALKNKQTLAASTASKLEKAADDETQTAKEALSGDKAAQEEAVSVDEIVTRLAQSELWQSYMKDTPLKLRAIIDEGAVLLDVKSAKFSAKGNASQATQAAKEYLEIYLARLFDETYVAQLQQKAKQGLKLVCQILLEKHGIDLSMPAVQSILVPTYGGILKRAAYIDLLREDKISEQAYFDAEIKAMTTVISGAIAKMAVGSPNKSTPVVASSAQQHAPVRAPQQQAGQAAQVAPYDYQPFMLMLRSPDWSSRKGIEIFDDTCYLYNRQQVANVGSVAERLTQGLPAELSDSNRAIDLNAETEDKLTVIQAALLAAIEQALATTGKLYVEPLGIELDDIAPDVLANLYADTIFSLPVEQQNKLDVTVPVRVPPSADLLREIEQKAVDARLPFEVDELTAWPDALRQKNAEFDGQLRLRLKQHRMVPWACQQLKLNAQDGPTNQALQTLFTYIDSPAFAGLLPDLPEKLNQVTACIVQRPANQGSVDLFKRNIGEVRELLAGLVIDALEIDGDVARLKDNYQAQLKPAAIRCQIELMRMGRACMEGLNRFVTLGQPFPAGGFRAQYVADDIQLALYQLALENPAQANALLDVKVCNSGGSFDAALAEFKADDRFPRYIIRHSSSKAVNGDASSGHWTHVVVNKGADGNLQPELVDSFATGFQNNGWTCGYHSLCGVARKIGVANLPNDDLRSDSQNRTATLRNWGVTLATGKNFDEWNRPLQPVVPASSQNGETLSQFFLRQPKPQGMAHASPVLSSPLAEKSITEELFGEVPEQTAAERFDQQLRLLIQDYEAVTQRINKVVDIQDISADILSAQIIALSEDVERVKANLAAIKYPEDIAQGQLIELRSITSAVAIMAQRIDTLTMKYQSLLAKQERQQPTEEEATSQARQVASQAALALKKLEMARFNSFEAITNPMLIELSSANKNTPLRNKYEQILAAARQVRVDVLLEHRLITPREAALDWDVLLKSKPELLALIKEMSGNISDAEMFKHQAGQGNALRASYIRAIVDAWDDTSSELYKALNIETNQWGSWSMGLFSQTDENSSGLSEMVIQLQTADFEVHAREYGLAARHEQVHPVLKALFAEAERLNQRAHASWLSAFSGWWGKHSFAEKAVRVNQAIQAIKNEEGQFEVQKIKDAISSPSSELYQALNLNTLTTVTTTHSLEAMQHAIAPSLC